MSLVYNLFVIDALDDSIYFENSIILEGKKTFGLTSGGALY
jgi:hypothetical protein